MFYSLRGKLIDIENLCIAVECFGVGYKCNVTQNTLNELPPIGNEIFIYTHLNVREDAMELFGFSKRNELNCFKLLTSVSGVGAKVGIAILSTLSPEQVALSVASNDTKLLTMAPGVGNKLAQRIILELKDKISKNQDMILINKSQEVKLLNDKTESAINALAVLGYSQSEAYTAVTNLSEVENMSVEDLIKNALKSIARRA